MKRTIVVGAGVIGLAAAYSLQKRGREVIVVDQGQPGEGASKGNAGWITPSISAPLPAPGLTWTSMKWMLNPDSPLYISPAAVPHLARWLWRFWRYCNQTDFLKGLHAVASLNRGTLAAFDRLEKDGVPFDLYRQGLVFAFTDQAYMEKVLQEFDYYRDYGYAVPEPLGAAQIQTLEPAVSGWVTSGFHVKEELHVRPETLSAGYVKALAAAGVEIRTGVTVQGAVRSGDQARGIETTAGVIEGDEILVAAGACTGQVVEHFGVRLPVQAGKGYSITIESGGPVLQRPLYLGGARVGCSPFGRGVRFAGTMELSGINTGLDRRRILGIRKGIARYLTTPVGATEGTEWVGMRPLTPDGLPILGRVPGYRNLFVASGHAMLGVTLAPVTGEVMADLMAGTGSAVDLKPFDPGRFHW